MDPLLRAALFQVSIQGPVDGLLRADGLLHALPAHLSQPQFEGFRLGRGDGLDDPQQLLRVGHIGEPLPAVGGGHLQLLTICKQLVRSLILMVKGTLFVRMYNSTRPVLPSPASRRRTVPTMSIWSMTGHIFGYYW